MGTSYVLYNKKETYPLKIIDTDTLLVKWMFIYLEGSSTCKAEYLNF